MRRCRLLILPLAFVLLISLTESGGVEASLKLASEWVTTSAMTRDATDAAQEGAAVEAPKKKKGGNAFARAIGAPFRALARLFGGGGNKRAKTQQAASTPPGQKDAKKLETTATLSDTATPQPAVTTTPATPAPLSAPVNNNQPQPVSQPGATPIVSGITPETSGRHATETVSAPPTQSPAVNIAAPLPAQSSPPPASAFPPAAALVAGTSQAAGAAEMNVPLAKFMPFVIGVARDPLSQGRALLELGLVEQAIAELSVAAIASPNLIEANNLLGLAYDRAGRHAEALASYERALSLAPGDAETLNNLGYSFYLNNQPQAALPLLKQAARRAPQNAGIAQNLALVYGRLGKYGDAYKTLKAVTSEYAARLQVAALLATAGRDRDAIKHLEAARRLQPAAHVPLEQLALLYERAGRLAEAAEARQQFRTSPDNPSQKSVATKEN